MSKKGMVAVHRAGTSEDSCKLGWARVGVTQIGCSRDELNKQEKDFEGDVAQT